MEIEEKKKILNEVEFLLREYESNKRLQSKTWEEESNIKNEMMKRIMTLSGEEEYLKKLNDLVGKRILLTEKDMDITILNVESVRLDKWEAYLDGDGVRICREKVYKAYGHTIKLCSLEDELNRITVITTDDTYNKIVQSLNDSMEVKKREMIEAIENKHKKTIDEFKLYYEGKISEEDKVYLCCHREDLLDEISGISLGKLKKLALGVEDTNEKFDIVTDD